jgi:hypothetical protein
MRDSPCRRSASDESETRETAKTCTASPSRLTRQD